MKLSLLPLFLFNSFFVGNLVYSQGSPFQLVEVSVVPGSSFNHEGLYAFISEQFKEKVVELCGNDGEAKVKNFSYRVETPDSLAEFTILDLSEDAAESPYVYFHGYQVYTLSAMLRCP